MKKNFFIALSPSFIDHSEMLIKKEFEAQFNILINPYDYESESELWEEKITGSSTLENVQDSLFNTFKYQKSKIVLYKNLLAKIKNLIHPEDSIHFFFCHIEEALNNYVYFYLQNKNVHYYLIEDGTLNYYPLRINFLAFIKFLFKKFFYLLLGFNFHPYTGYMSGIDRDNILNQYVKRPDIAVFPEKSVSLPFKHIDFEPDANTILVIGQEGEINKYGVKKYGEGVKEIFQLIQSQFRNAGMLNIYYKPHRNGLFPEADFQKILSEIGFNHKIKFLNKKEAIENMVSEIRPASIYTFWSTAILNMAISSTSALRNKIKLYSLDFFPNSLRSVFEKVGIEIIE